jgi:hypothetical protein
MQEPRFTLFDKRMQHVQFVSLSARSITPGSKRQDCSCNLIAVNELLLSHFIERNTICFVNILISMFLHRKGHYGHVWG